MARERVVCAPLMISAALLFQVACGGDDPLAPRVATTLAANSTITLTGVAGAAATPLPSVLVRDQDGAAMAGATVNFVLVTGGGFITGGSATTNASGIATLASWTLGTVAGPNTVTANLGTLTPITFTATGTAGAPATLTKSAGDDQVAAPGAAVPIAPAVIVRDANGNLVPNAVVTFTAALGGGTVTGPQATSTAAGVATVGSWVLGSAGPNTLTASATGATTVTFNANAGDPCDVETPHAFGTTSSGQLTTADCNLGTGHFFDFYGTTLPSATAYRFSQTSGTFDTQLFLLGPTGLLVAFNDDAPPPPSTNSAIKALVLPGSYLFAATSFAPNQTGAYTLTSAVATAEVTNCEDVWVGRGISTTQSLQTTDCIFQGFYDDDYLIFLRTGQSVTISMTSTAFDAFLGLYSAAGQLVASNNDRDGTTTDAQIVYTPTVNDYFFIGATSNLAGRTGAYTLSISAAPVGAEIQGGAARMQVQSLARPLMATKPTMTRRPPH